MAAELVADDGIASKLWFPIGLFASVGAGIGLTVFFILNQLGGESAGAFVGAFLSLIVVVVTLSLGPVMAAVVGLWTGVRHQTDTYLVAAVGSALGYLVMVLLVVVLLVVGLPDGGSSAGSASASSSGGGSGFDAGQWLVPIVLVMLPTAGVGVVGAWLSSE